MSWLCLFTLSCLTNPPAPMSMPTLPEPTEVAIPAATHVRPAPLRCELRQVRRDGAQMVLAVVHAGAPAEGEYEFSVGPRDAGGSTLSSSTGDEFRIRAGERLDLEGPSFSLGRGVALAGRLELRDARGQILTACRL
jgi:hypothetical protein